jgi:hypothetical protein
MVSSTQKNLRGFVQRRQEETEVSGSTVIPANNDVVDSFATIADTIVKEVKPKKQTRAKQVSVNTTKQETWSDRFDRSYPRMLDALNKFTSIVFNLIKALILTAGSLISFFIVISVEHHRLEVGVSSVEPDLAYASMIAYAIILLAFFFESAIIITKHKNGYQKTSETRTLKSFLLGIWNLVVGDSEEKPEHNKYETMLAFIVLTIIYINLSTVFTSPAPSFESIKGNLIAVLLLEAGSSSSTITVIYSLLDVIANLIVTLMLVFASIRLTDSIMTQAIEAESVIRDKAFALENKHMKVLSKISKNHSVTIFNAIDPYRHLFNDKDVIDTKAKQFVDGITGLRGKSYSTQASLAKDIVRVLEARE